MRLLASGLLGLALVGPVAAGAQAQALDEALVGQLARVLRLADEQRYDAAVLQEILTHPEPAVRRQGALAAGRIGDRAAVDLLLGMLEDTTIVVRSAAAFALGMLGDARAIPTLAAALRGVNPQTQDEFHLEAVTAVAKIGGEEGARLLGDLLAGGDVGGTQQPPVTLRILLEAWRLGPHAPVQPLIRAAETGAIDARRNALYSLSRLRITAAARPLFAGLQDREAEIRLVASRGLQAALADSARLERRAVIARLQSLLRDEGARIRINALRALASFRDSSAVPSVVPFLSDADLGVQVQAETTLGALGGGAAAAALATRATGGGAFGLRRQAIIALAEAAPEQGTEAAASLLDEEDWRWRRVAAEAFGAARNRPRLEAQLADQDGRVVAAALEALARIVPDSDAALLTHARRLLEQDDPAVRSVAADALGRRPQLGDLDALVVAYRRADGDPFNDARLSALGAIAAIAQTGTDARLAVLNRFIAAVPRPEDYLVRRLAAQQLPEAAQAWGPAEPIATGRSDVDYRDVVRRFLLPAIGGAPADGASTQEPFQVTIDTDRGTLIVRLLPADAPLTVAAFVELVRRRFFDGHRWHRMVPNFVVQDGDPRGDGWGAPGAGFVLRDEVNPARYRTGTMGMALSGPDTGGSQFFITHSAQPHLDGTYTVFGEVIAGTNILPTIMQGDRIRSIH